MKKKLAAVALSLALAATAVTGASLAYFTDTDTAENRFTTGNVQIALQEQQRDIAADGTVTLVEFAQDKKLIPYTGEVEDTEHRLLEKNYVDKIVNVTNTGSQDAYVRVLATVPAAMEEALHIDWCGPDWTVEKSDAQVTHDGHLHDVYVITYKTVLPAGASSQSPAMQGLLLDPHVDYRPETGYTLHGEPIGFDIGDTSIAVTAQAVQAAGFDTPADAFAAADLSLTDWAAD